MKLSFVIFLSFLEKFAGLRCHFFPTKEWDDSVSMLSCFYFFNVDLSFSVVGNSLPLKPYTQSFKNIKAKPKNMRNICKTNKCWKLCNI